MEHPWVVVAASGCITYSSIDNSSPPRILVFSLLCPFQVNLLMTISDLLHRPRLIGLMAVFSLFSLFTSALHATETDKRALMRISAPHTPQRHALIIGNNTYEKIGTLSNAVGDARAVKSALDAAGFKTVLLLNASRNDMSEAVNQFVDDIAGGGEGVLFFAGHGVQINNQNYLLPVDMREPRREADIADQGVSLQGIQDKVAEAKARFTLLVVDACRDNPLPKKAGRTLGSTRGLAQASSAQGQMVVFSAGANQQALDKLSPTDTNPNSLFTREWLNWLNKPGVSVRQAMLEVRQAVFERAKTVRHDQFPAVYDQVLGDFYFVPPPPPPPPQLPVAVAPILLPAATPAPVVIIQSSAQQPLPQSEDPVENAYWQETSESGQFEAYLREYPKGRYVALAQVAIQKREEAKIPQDVKQKDDAAWATAQAANTVAAYQDYLKDQPQGRYGALAKLRVQRLHSLKDLMEWQSKKPGDVFQHCLECPEMVVLPAGSFEMGANDGNSDEKPVQTVQVKSFAIGKTEVTQGQWKALMDDNPSGFSNCGNDCPVETVSWEDAQAYVKKLSEKTGHSYRLPTEAEWEYACRAGGRHTYCGSEVVGAVAWYDGNSKKLVKKGGELIKKGGLFSKDKYSEDKYEQSTHPVATKQANAWGLHDMSGNVWEWVEDCYHDSYTGAPMDGSARTGNSCEMRVLRGGSWGSSPGLARSATRFRNTPAKRFDYYGFRLARGARTN